VLGLTGDTNRDGVVDITDLNNVRNNLGTTAVPEPSAVSLGILALLGFVVFHRRVK